jgi:hypothetical protein
MDLGWHKKKSSKGKTNLLWSFHIGTFRKLLLIRHSRRLELILMGLLDYRISNN